MDDCPLRMFCDAYLPKGVCLPHRHSPFGIMCIEEKTCAPLSGAFLTVFRDGQEIGAASSDETGAALFSPICPGSYLLKASHAAGWQANERAYTLLIAPNGRESVDGISIAYAKICFAKQKETKQ